MRTAIAAVLLIVSSLMASSAQAQFGNYFVFGSGAGETGTPVRPSDTRLPIVTGGPLSSCPGPCSGFVALSAFADTAAVASLQSQVATLSAQIDGSLSAIAATQIQNQVAATNLRLARLNGEVTRSLEIGAIAASMRDAIPNPGDRFAIRLNAAAFDGYAGGSIGVSMNLTDAVRFSANYGRGTTQNIVSGGVNISLH